MNASTLLAFSFLFILEQQSMDWCCPQSGWVFPPQWAQKFSHWHMNRAVSWVILDHVGLTISVGHRCSGGLRHRTAFWSPATYLKVYSRARDNTARQEASMRDRIRASFLKQRPQGTGETALLVKCLSCKHGDQSLVPQKKQNKKTQTNKQTNKDRPWTLWLMLVILVLER